MNADRSAYAPDGSPVGLYARLPPLGEPELVHEAVPAGCTILELGAGAGRITHALLALGHRVVAVDVSPEMLAHVRGAETVCADIRTLALGRRFAAVLLASNFVNDAGDAARSEYLACCARHVLPDGRVLIERFPPDWTPQAGWREHGPVRMRLREASVRGSLVEAVMEYLVDGQTFTHEFESRILDDGELDAELRVAGLRLRRVLDERRAWVEAVPGVTAEPRRTPGDTAVLR